MYEDERKEDTQMAARERGQVADQLSRLDEMVDRLFKDEDSIEAKLEPILRRSYPNVAVDQEADSPELVPLADKLYNVVETLNRLHHRFMDIDDRISL